ncbi:peptide chain release factor N(5)-glutamine methyltransferase [Gordonia caeni]|uniref:Release factor glutamine methyltransferase n=1 Tax=Gordonia caeni TaxID=1007097 RepID=A0ABP7PA10_9ACTN
MTPAERTGATGLRTAAARRLAAAGIDSAAGEAAALLAHVLGIAPGRLVLVDQVDLGDAEAFEALIARRAQRIPLQHLTGQAYFAGLELAVGPGVFVPRPETELLADWAVRTAATMPDGPLRVADLCAGSGALALAVAAAVPRAQVVAVERAPAALEYLRRNVAAQPAAVAGRVHVVAGDALDRSGWPQPCDLIVSNPPYVPAAAPVSDEVAHDPAEAVFSGDHGMDLITAMVPVIAAALIPGGAVAVEHDDTAAVRTAAVFAADGRFTDVVSHDDLAGRPRYVTARRNGAGAVQGWNA